MEIKGQLASQYRIKSVNPISIHPSSLLRVLSWVYLHDCNFVPYSHYYLTVTLYLIPIII